MAGHSRWAQIKRTKAVVDAKRGALFTRLGREITVAARGGADPAGNFQLRTAIEKAKAGRLPAANIERAIAKGCGQAGGGDQFEAVRYEGYGPGGVAVLIESLTDNRNRAAAEIRLAFSKNGGNLGETGCVGYLFEHRSVVRLEQANLSEEALLEGLLELEAQGGRCPWATSSIPRERRCWAASPTSKPCRTGCAASVGRWPAGSTAGSPRPPAGWRIQPTWPAASDCSMPSKSSTTCAA